MSLLKRGSIDAFLLLLPLSSSPWNIQHAQITHIGSVNFESHGCDGGVKSIDSRRPGVYDHHAVDLIVHNPPDMGMSAYEQTRFLTPDQGQRLTIVPSGITADVGHQNPECLRLKRDLCRKL